jgi:hypothetical protein
MMKIMNWKAGGVRARKHAADHSGESAKEGLEGGKATEKELFCFCRLRMWQSRSV